MDHLSPHLLGIYVLSYALAALLSAHLTPFDSWKNLSAVLWLQFIVTLKKIFTRTFSSGQKMWSNIVYAYVYVAR